MIPDGYVWREATYASLATIARAITGTAWKAASLSRELEFTSGE